MGERLISATFTTGEPARVAASLTFDTAVKGRVITDVRGDLWIKP